MAATARSASATAAICGTITEVAPASSADPMAAKSHDATRTTSSAESKGKQRATSISSVREYTPCWRSNAIQSKPARAIRATVPGLESVHQTPRLSTPNPVI